MMSEDAVYLLSVDRWCVYTTVLGEYEDFTALTNSSSHIRLIITHGNRNNLKPVNSTSSGIKNLNKCIRMYRVYNFINYFLNETRCFINKHKKAMQWHCCGASQEKRAKLTWSVVFFPTVTVTTRWVQNKVMTQARKCKTDEKQKQL